jgi:hypothetical protein
MAGDFRHHQGTTDGASSVPTTVNKTVVPMTHTFCEFVPGAPFHPPISHSTALLPTDPVIPSRANSLLNHDKHHPLLRSPDPWGSLTLRHVRRTHQQNYSFRKSVYKIPTHRSTFAPIASALSLARSIPSWVFSCFGSVGATRASPCGSGGPVIVALRGSSLGQPQRCQGSPRGPVR